MLHHRFLLLLRALLLAAALSGPASGQVLADFTKPAEAAAWRAIGASPAPERTPLGVTFRCPFDTEVDRAYWDRDGRVDLSRCSSLLLELTCDEPAALRTCSLYLRSGDGWYVWGKPLREGGRQTLLLRKEDFSTEGRPAGWDRIDKIRLSPWKGSPRAARITLHRLEGRQDSVFVVQSTLSAPNAGERAYAARVAERVSGWLETRGIAHTVIPEERHAELARATLVLLPYNPEPPAAVLASLRRYVERGGKLIVCYSASSELAALMHVKLGDYQRTDDPARWAGFTFLEPARWHVPAEVAQGSGNLRTVTPLQPTGSVIAWWVNASGERTKDPAWVATERGLWMSHVLLDDDGFAKARMLVGLAGALAPGIWADAARHALERAGKIDSYADLQQAAVAIESSARGGPSAGRVKQLIATARTTYDELFALYRAGRPADVVEGADRLRAILTEAYGLAQSPRPGEFRGVWDHDGTGWYPGHWDRTCEVLARHKINAIFPNLLWGGLAHYPSKVLPTSATVRMYGDQAAASVEAAHARGLQVHAWKVCWNVGNAPADFVAQMKRENRLQVGADGRSSTWLNPADPRNVQLELAAIEEAVRTYAFDGIHLDYVRYPGSDFDFSATSRTYFEKALGRRVPDWPKSVRAGGKLRPEYVKWRCGVITDFVRRAGELVRRTRPGTKLSAAVWGGYPDTIPSIGQDWALWLKAGYVDFVCPMNYTEDLFRFNALVARQMALPGARGRVYPGLGVTAAESQLLPDQAVEQVLALRRQGASGFMLFDLSHSVRADILPVLSLGLTR